MKFKMPKYKKITLVFPGQGSQYPGMGKDLYQNFACVKEIYEQANRILGYDLAEQCFKKPKLGKKLIQSLDQQTEDGFVFRVDMRLRPFGAGGPLVSSFTFNFLLRNLLPSNRY